MLHRGNKEGILRDKHQRQLTSIAPSGSVWEGTVYAADGSVKELIYGSKSFVERRLSGALPTRLAEAGRARGSDSGEFDRLSGDLDNDATA